MTEKRFTTDNGSNEDVCLVDNITGKEYESNFDDIVDLLNEQNETITEQASQIDFLKDENQHMRTVLEENKKLKQDLKQIQDSLWTTEHIRKLEKENEQLKKVIAENEKLIQSTYDELTKLRCIKKNLGRIKTQWDWIMEAIQYD